MSEYNGVWVFSEAYDLTLEMLGKGRELANKLQTELVAVLLGYNVQEKTNDLIKYGADKVYLIDDPNFERFQAEPYLSVLHNLSTSYRPEILIIGSTRNGKPLAARLATRLDTGCVPDCIRLSVNDDRKLIGDRITYGGNAVARVTFKSKPQIATVPARAFEKPNPQERNGEIVKLNVNIEAPKVEIVERKPLETSSVRVEEAEVIVSCGRGLEKKDDIALLAELAEVLGGQVGCSRPLVEDRKWFSEIGRASCRERV
jgi:electron transfer flavoprotein alpha subunit